MKANRALTSVVYVKQRLVMAIVEFWHVTFASSKCLSMLVELQSADLYNPVHYRLSITLLVDKNMYRPPTGFVE